MWVGYQKKQIRHQMIQIGICIIIDTLFFCANKREQFYKKLLYICEINANNFIKYTLFFCANKREQFYKKLLYI